MIRKSFLTGCPVSWTSVRPSLGFKALIIHFAVIGSSPLHHTGIATYLLYIGHLLSFYRNPSALQGSARLILVDSLLGYKLIIHRNYFNSSRQPFTITVAGTKLYVLTNPSHISEAYRNSSSLSFDIFVKILIRTCSTPARVVEKLYQDPPPPRERTKSLGRAIHDFQVQQTSGQKLEDLSAVFVACFEKSLLFEDLAVNDAYDTKASEATGSACISLSKWCADIVINATQKAYFGERLSRIDPHLAQTFIEFDIRSWQLLYRFPRFISKPMYTAKDQINNALTAYFKTPAEDKNDAAWVTKTLEKEMRVLGFTEREMGTLMFLQYWG